MIYVDDGQTWDNCSEVCDAFYERLTTRFSTTVGGGGMSYMLGTDIAMGEGWLRISSSTYILNLCQRWLPHPIEEYDHIDTPATHV